MSWPKRDCIQSFLRHLGPFGWMTAAIFSENAKSWKSRFGEFLDYWASTDQTVQKSLGFGFFHTPWHVWGVWKNAKTQSHLVKFGCGSPVIQKFPKPRFPTFFTKYRCRHPSTPAPPGAPLTPGMSSWVILDQNNVLCTFKKIGNAYFFILDLRSQTTIDCALKRMKTNRIF